MALNDTTTKEITKLAEEGLVSTLLYLPDQIREAIGVINKDDFTNTNLSVIYNAITKIDESSSSVDFASVVSYLVTHGDLQRAGGLDEVRRLFNDGAINGTMQSVSHWAKIIKEESTKNKIAPVLVEANEALHTPGVMAKDIISSAQTSLDEVALGMTDSNEIVDIADYFDEYAESVEEGVKRYRDSGGNPLAATNGVPTGFKTLDKYVGGWQPGSLITLGGRTGTGKSFTATNFLVAAANAGRSIMFFSLEMAAQEIMNRIMAMTAHVKLAPLTKGALNDADVEKVKQAREHFKKLKISIDTTSNMDVNHIKAAAMKKMMSDDGLDLIIVDYLQLITPDPTRKNDNRERQVAEISRALKLLAGQLKVPIIDLVQLNREKKDDEDPTPTINDIRESGAIAQNSNVIILIHRNIKSDDGKEPTLFIIGKNRGNRCGIKFKCHTMLSYGQFLEMDDDGTAFDDDGNTDDQSTSDNGDYVSDDPDKIDEWINDESESSEIGGYDDFDSFGA